MPSLLSKVKFIFDDGILLNTIVKYLSVIKIGSRLSSGHSEVKTFLFLE